MSNAGSTAGFDPELRRNLKALADGRALRRAVSSAPRSGTRLVREWNGRTYQVDVKADGYVTDGERFKSLSAIALRITGTSWSGPLFSGLHGAIGAAP